MLVAVPPVVVTRILPVVAPDGTVAFTCDHETYVTLALTPLNLTFVEEVNAVPLMVTTVPTGPLVGEKSVIVGTTLNFVSLVSVPPGAVTLM